MNEAGRNSAVVKSSSVAALVSLYRFNCVTAAAVLGLRVLFCCLLYCFLEGLQANHARPYEGCFIAGPSEVSRV